MEFRKVIIERIESDSYGFNKGDDFFHITPEGEITRYVFGGFVQGTGTIAMFYHEKIDPETVKLLTYKDVDRLKTLKRCNISLMNLERFITCVSLSKAFILSNEIKEYRNENNS